MQLSCASARAGCYGFGMSESGQPIQRAQFTATQRLQAQYVGHVTDAHRAARRQIPSYPIDNVDPEVVSDRDDGVYVEAEHRNGGYRVHVTIADVAAHIRPGSPLAQAAWMRAFTLYFGRGTDPMFPNGTAERLEEKMSLEHNRERLGLTVSITLDDHFRPVHTSFTPVITHPDNSSYKQAHERMQRDPQFQLMADIAHGVKRSYFGGHDVPLEEIFSHRTLKRVHSQEQLKAMEMVATYMLLANSCTAEFANKSQLPFLYRNFDETANATHATYGTDAVRHTALERMGLKGAYCHFTSPIRRAPDYFNGAMIHYAIDVVEQLEQRLRARFPQSNARALRHALWDQAPELLTLISDPTTNRTIYRAAMQRLLGDVLGESMTGGAVIDERPIREIVNQLQFDPPPYTREELQAYADHMNALARSPEIRTVERANEKYELSIDRLSTAPVADKDAMADLPRDKFSSLLAAAATTGDMPRPLFDEAMSRIRFGTFDKVNDSYTVFIRAQHEGVHRWTALKRRVAQLLKNDPSTVNTIMVRFENEIAPATVHAIHTTLPGETPEGRSEPSQISASLYAMEDGDESLAAPPFYSVGHDRRAAQSHARYSFLEHYAFEQLQPIDQTTIPNLLYAELDMEGAKKRELLKQMADSVGAEVHYEQETTGDGRYIARVIVEGGELPMPILTDADEPTADEAEHVALRRMLRNDSFKAAVSGADVGREMLNPQTVLEELVTQRGGRIEITPNPRPQGLHQARIDLDVNGQKLSFAAGAPNLDRAKRAAAVKALEHFGWSIGEAPVKSWVTDSQRPALGKDRHYFGSGK